MVRQQGLDCSEIDKLFVVKRRNSHYIAEQAAATAKQGISCDLKTENLQIEGTSKLSQSQKPMSIAEQ